MTKNSTPMNTSVVFKNKDLDENCSQKEYCLEVLELMLDSEATAEQAEFYLKHIESCRPCYEAYQVETQVRQLFKAKIQKKAVPSDLLDAIKNKIKQTV